MGGIPEETWQQVWAIRLMAWFTIGWFFCLGACLGSFLNVVVWRWPLGRSVIREPSACPVCATKILWYDNLPIIGWIRLRGRCRACGVSIPIRYPLVEAVVGVQFVLLLCAEALTGGATLPVRTIDHYAGVVWIIWYAMQPQLLRIYAWHLGLLYVSNIVWLIDEDRQRVPRKLWAAVLLIGLTCITLFPDLHPLLDIRLHYGGSFTWDQRLRGLVSGGIGWLVGSLLGFLMLPPSATEGRRRQWAQTLMLGSVGLALGMHAVISTALIASGIAWLVAPLRRLAVYRGPRSALFPLWLAIPVQLLAWRWLDSQWWWLGSQTTWPVLLAAGSLAVLLSRWGAIADRATEAVAMPDRSEVNAATLPGPDDSPAAVDELPPVEDRSEPETRDVPPDDISGDVFSGDVPDSQWGDHRPH